MVEVPALELDRQNWKIYCAKILEGAATLDVLDVLAGWRTEPDDADTDDWKDWCSCDCSAKWLVYPILPPQLVTPIRKLQTTHEMFVFLACKFHDTDPIKRDAKKEVETCTNNEVSNGQSGSASLRAAETYWTVERAGIATESPENLPKSGDGQETYRDENVQVEMMRKQPKTFAGTCHRCGEVGHQARDCRRSVDLPKCSTNEVATTTDGRTKAWGHKVCYNPKRKSRKGSECESMAVKRTTNALECVVDGQQTNLLREVSDKEEKDLLDMLDGLQELQAEPQELQNLPIVGESRDSRRQVAEAFAMVVGTNGRAKVIRKAADVDGKALLGRELANRASRVDEAEETPDGHQPQAKQVKSYYKESQRNENTERNLPSAHGVPFEGEWSVCASSGIRLDSREDGMGERGCIDEWSWPVEKSRPTVRIPKGYCQLGRVDGNVSCKEMLVDSQGKSEKLVPTTVELDDPGGGETPRVCLGGTKMRVGERKGHGCRADESKGQANESKGQADASTVLNTCKTVAMGDGGGTGARSDAGDARRDRVGPDGHANQSDALSGHRDVPDICNSVNTTADATESISTRRNTPQMQNLPVKAWKRNKVESRSCAGMPNMRVDTHGIAIHVNTAGDTQKHISTRTEDTKVPDLPTGSTTLRQDGTDGLESCPGMQTARVHVQDVAESNKSENTSVKSGLLPEAQNRVEMVQRGWKAKRTRRTRAYECTALRMTPEHL